ncbi:GSCOCG00013153001-RA-CDS [Cotesia congregata]|uniref:Similar to tamo: Protein tamozhennic (Drosophila melanogaster) n=1 Tax=Cotesia congregata TaxID=51543 RepID=A0A8J2MSG8_COTCN|nr:GSCOCG00013153001-RA-CDS [Cotesia congregata]CAG5093004.1 Similar to tamo: Protein tamozhennic (Drosophila melanogaster) [Cotesia congregata]
MMAFDILDRPGAAIIDKLEEISINVEKSHLAYLQMDESEEKLALRHKLEGFIKEYLHLVPHENKYVFEQTAHILHQSAAILPDFSGYRACSAWIAISLYAANLLAQPWRKEYRTLRTYSGYYKHEIETNLIGAELMFELMGYKPTLHERGVMTLEGPIDPDRVSFVSRDAIVAFVECQIMKQIWENVSQTFTVSWLEVLEFREKHVGTPENAIRALNHRFWERCQQRRKNYDLHYAQPAIINSPINEYQTGIKYPINYRPDVVPVPGTRSSVPGTAVLGTGIRSTVPGTAVLGTGTRNTVPGTAVLGTGIQRVPMLPLAANYVPDNYRYEDLRYFESDLNNHYNQVYGVPTYAHAPLIEFDGSYDKRSHRRSKSSTTAIKPPDQFDGGNKSSPIKTSMSLDSATASNDSWDFVYRSLKDLGYSKDVAEREDVLRNERQSKRRESSDKFEERRRSRSSKNANYNGNSNPRIDKAPLIDLGATYNYDSEGSDLMVEVKGRNKRDKDQVCDLVKNMKIDGAAEATWSCLTCTFFNAAGKEICEMCGKSRRKGNEDIPLASGGKVCPKCTLVNEKEAFVCEACQFNLKDSPTYI